MLEGKRPTVMVADDLCVDAKEITTEQIYERLSELCTNKPDRCKMMGLTTPVWQSENHGENPFTEWHKWNYLDEDIKWELEYLKDDTDDIFDKAIHEIRSAYYAPRCEAQSYFHNKKRHEALMARTYVMESTTFPSKEWEVLTNAVLITIQDGMTEGFGDWLSEIGDTPTRMQVAVDRMLSQPWDFARLIECYRDQLCEMYR